MTGAGRYRHRVTVQAPAFTRDPKTNQKLASWRDVATIWGLLQPLHGREAVNAQQLKAEVTTKFTTRWQGAALTLDESMRLAHGGSAYQITQVLNIDERNRELQVLCTKVPVPNQ
jgi:SPP1 family predicted phage head-tail adaptor